MLSTGIVCPNFAGSRIGDVGLVDDHRAPLLASAVDLQLAFRAFHHARNQRQSLADCGGIGGKSLDFQAMEFVVLGWCPATASLQHTTNSVGE